MIEVQIPEAVMLRNSQHDVWAGNVVCNALREAGIPIEGKLFPQWPTEGCLSVHVDEDDVLGKTYVWRWTTVNLIDRLPPPSKKRRKVLDNGIALVFSGADINGRDVDL